jgi:hypothetical protein
MSQAAAQRWNMSKVMYGNFHIKWDLNPLSASCSCDARIGGCQQNAEWAARDEQTTSTNQKRVFATHYCISPRTSKPKLTLSLLLDVGRMGCSSFAAHSDSIHQSKRVFATVNLSLMHFTQDIQSFSEPLLHQNLPYGNHGTERVKKQISANVIFGNFHTK